MKKILGKPDHIVKVIGTRHGEKLYETLLTKEEMVKAIDEKVLNERIIPQIPVGRLGEPEEIARCVVFLAGDGSGFISGSTLSANGAQYFS